LGVTTDDGCTIVDNSCVIFTAENQLNLNGNLANLEDLSLTQCSPSSTFKVRCTDQYLNTLDAMVSLDVIDCVQIGQVTPKSGLAPFSHYFWAGSGDWIE
jgi:hypothetical protein